HALTVAGGLHGATRARAGSRVRSAAPRLARGRGAAPLPSVRAQGAYELRLAHRGPAVDADLGGPLAQLVDGPVVVVARLPALAPDARAGRPRCGVRDAGRLLLRVALVAQLLVQLGVLHARARLALRHVGLPPVGPATRSAPAPRQALADRWCSHAEVARARRRAAASGPGAPDADVRSPTLSGWV